jgi:NADPH-dependent 2,4-dienoyl-CoA reductase/sulfur reductase-like enzyme/rhodanese-related sulfurtransferase
MKTVIIGGVAGGATAAARLRRLDESAKIVILERSGFVSYANCGLPYYIGGTIKDKDDLTLQTPESFWNRFHIDVRVQHEVTAIEPASKTVTVRRLDDGSDYTETYDKLILSPGAKAIRPRLPGVEDKRIMTLRTVEDAYRIRDFIVQSQPRQAIVIGGGFVGLEMAENLIGAGVRTALLQHGKQVMPPLDYDMACQLHSYLRDQGIDLHLNTSVSGFEVDGDDLLVLREEGEPLRADLVLMSIGVVPDTGLARDAGLKSGAKGSIVVNDHMQTSVPDIYAVGDAVEIRNFITNQRLLIPLAGPANKQGRIAADNIHGLDSTFTGAQGSSVIKLFGMTVATTGINEKLAERAGIVCDKVVTFSASHATYYPGATNMTVKTLFDPTTGKILGAQIIGFEGVDKRIDVLATAIRAGMKASDLEELELAYAPPYSSAKDPVNMAGFVIEDVRSGLVKQYHWHDVEGLIDDESVTLVDVRSVGEYQRGHIPGTVNIPLDGLREHLDLLDPAKPLYVNCQSGLRSYIACRILTQRGFDCYNLSGGYRFYEYVATDRRYDADPTHPCGLKISKG